MRQNSKCDTYYKYDNNRIITQLNGKRIKEMKQSK